MLCPHAWQYQLERYNCDLIKTLFNFWLVETRESEDKRNRVACSPPPLNNQTQWKPILRDIPIFKGVTVKYSFMGVLALSLTCKSIRTMCLTELPRWWRQLCDSIRNHVNRWHLHEHSFPIIVRFAGSGGRRHSTGTMTAQSDHSRQLLCETCQLELIKHGGEANEESNICIQCRIIVEPAEETFSGATLLCWCDSDAPDRCRKTWLRNGWTCAKIMEAQKRNILPAWLAAP